MNAKKVVTARHELNSIPVHSPRHHIDIDFIGPISPESNVNDYFIKWVSAAALPAKKLLVL